MSGQAGHEARSAPGPADPDRRIRVAVTLVALEVVALLALAAFEVLNVDRGRLSVGITTAAFFLLYAAGLAFSARGLLHLRSWSRGPVVLAQLIELGVAWSFYGPGTAWVTILVAIPPVVVLFVVLSPATTQALYGERSSSQDRQPGD